MSVEDYDRLASTNPKTSEILNSSEIGPLSDEENERPLFIRFPRSRANTRKVTFSSEVPVDAYNF